MFNSISELKEFLSWCASNGVTNVKVGDMSAVIDPNAVPRDSFSQQIEATMIAENALKRDKELEREPVDRELLFWSGGKR